ncbi:uncharacterized protein CMU_002740 [Cryptosporidium muris RN66]|uniref:Transmembrane protein 230 n=1 Tax=Cryptosporidium muris (strain RN66) TaxID=441375 RepID=B6AJQ4_CRYMR|nr:uncharacterized protein CMU_002740 [Cryptosporidium muris RN66]EEA08445.1 hypothetical protein, conserved [Cryptosporidium muris RN66]|eukprot:XP_002142794.1 hypothetical protein [Cryptosporidium muris RN66]
MENNKRGSPKFSLQPRKPLRQRPKPWRLIAIALLLFILGGVFLTIGTNNLISGNFSESIPSLIIGSLCFIPGCYHVFIIIQTLRNVPDYSLDIFDSYIYN